jgi:hypothetical protein
MKKARSLLCMTASAAAILAGAAIPAAADSGDTITTFTLTAGALSISVQANAALSNGVAGDAVVSGQLGTVTVTDARGGLVAWSVAATSTTFTGGAGTSASTHVSYDPGSFSTTGSVILQDAQPVSLTGTPANVVVALSVSGNNTVSWNPTLAVSMPPAAIAGDYTGTINTSVS